MKDVWPVAFLIGFSLSKIIFFIYLFLCAFVFSGHHGLVFFKYIIVKKGELSTHSWKATKTVAALIGDSILSFLSAAPSVLVLNVSFVAQRGMSNEPLPLQEHQLNSHHYEV